MPRHRSFRVGLLMLLAMLWAAASHELPRATWQTSRSAEQSLSAMEKLALPDAVVRTRLQALGGAWKSEGARADAWWLPDTEARSGARLRASVPPQGDGGWEVSVGSIRLRLALDQARAVNGSLRGGRAIYPDVLENTDMLLVAGGSYVEQFLLVRSERSPARFVLRMDSLSGNLHVRPEPSGALALADSAGSLRARMPRPFAIDARGSRRDADLSWNDGCVSITFDRNGLQYPVLLDPGIEIVEWDQVTGLTTTPLARTDHAMSTLGKIVLFGGVTGSSLADGTWQWDGTAWTLKATQHTPPLRSAHAMAPYTGKLVLFGGATPGGMLGDTWVWDGTDWTDVSPSNGAPSARAGHAMALSIGTTLKVVLFGGKKADGSPLADTWQWDGSAWVQLFPSSSPPARYGQAMATLGANVVLFGGQDANGYLGDTWQWDGSNWTPKPSGPPPRARHGLANHESVLVLFGGEGGTTFDDTWEWDGSAWSQKTPSLSPSGRAGPALASLASNTVLYGGGANGDTWIYRSGLDNGSNCTAPKDCASGLCADGVCCDTACTGQCEACNLTGKVGTCTANSGQPAAGRPPCAGTSACTGSCDGTQRSECTFPGTDVTCAEATCGSGVSTPVSKCNAAGSCLQGEPTKCGDYGCSADHKCNTTCAAPSDCASGATCVASRCVMVDAGSDALPDGQEPDAEKDDAQGADDADAGEEQSGGKSGCGCQIPGRTDPAGWVWAAFGIVIFVRQRWRRGRV